MKKQNNRIALVTGASRSVGIGSAIALELARDGIDVFTTYYRPYDQETGLASKADDPEKLIADIRKMGCRAEGLEIDLSAKESPKELFDHVEATFGTVSILVNNATYSMRDGIENLTAEQLDKCDTSGHRSGCKK